MSEQLEYKIRRSERGYVVSGPALSRPSVFDSENKAVALSRALIGGKPAGGFIIRSDGTREFFQSERYFSSSQR
jgi:hypothetical protein